MSPDPELERQRLAELYAGMSDGELLEIAADARTLTETAELVLQEEIERRDLDGDELDGDKEDTVESTGTEQPNLELRQLVTIRQFRDLPQALLAKGMLDSAGIECFLGDDNMVRLDWFISNLLGGIKLRVKAEDVRVANELLDQPIPDEFDVEGVGEYLQPHCPKCLSLDITFEALNKPVAYTSAWVGLPVPLAQNSWKCETCGHRWEEAEL